MTTVDTTAGSLGQPQGGHYDEGSYLTPKGGTWATILQWATTVDHKKIGVMYLFAVLIMIFLGGAAALAAALAGKVRLDERSVIMLTGGNADPVAFAQTIGRQT